jgi:ATP-dependent exoDNAse (exonuclease V) alpha subunit
MMDEAPLEGRLRQDDYQDLMNISRVACNTAPLLGFRELDNIHPWLNSWHGKGFDFLLSWIRLTKKNSVLPPVPCDAIEPDCLSAKQRIAFDIVYNHTFGAARNEQLLLLVVGTAGTGKSFLINAVRHLFDRHSQADALKITAPTGIAAANISGSTIFSLLSLLNNTLNGRRLYELQTLMKDVRLLVIDEYSFISISVFDSLDRHLCTIFPHRTHAFGGMNIVLCSDPAQLPPVLAQPVYAYRGQSRHLASCFHLFDNVVILDHPFRQSGDDEQQIRFRRLLRRLADCNADLEDWHWLQTRRACCLSTAENLAFDNSTYIVSTNKTHDQINYDKLSAFAPIMNIDAGDEDLRNTDEHVLDSERLEDNGWQLFAVDAQVMSTANLWTETGLVNGARGVVAAILTPDDDRKAHVVMVDFPKYRGPSLFPLAPTVLPITQVRDKDCKGMPLTLSWAISIHKAQGMTLDRATVDIGKSEFSSGLTFVALSRAKTFDGLRTVAFDYDRYRCVERGSYVDARREEFERLERLAAHTTQ